MNAVNLIPADQRRSFSMSASPQFLGLLGGLALILIAAVTLVAAHSRIAARQSQLNSLTTAVSRWTAAVDTYSGYTSTLNAHNSGLSEVKALADARYDWARLLGQIAAEIPADAQLSSLTASSPATAAAAAATSGLSGSAPIQILGCASSQPAVAETMVRLRNITGIASVTLASSTNSGSAGAASSGTSGACSLPVQFTLSLGFDASLSGTGTPAAGSTPTGGS